MSKKNKLSEMRARKDAIEAKIKALRESRSRTGLAFLIESELEKAEIVLAAKSIVDKLGKMAEDLAKVEGDDVMPMMDSLKAAYGPQMADAFQKTASETLRNIVQSLTQAKDALGTEVGKFEGVLNGDSTGNDMSMAPAAPAEDPMADADMGGLDANAGADMNADADMDSDMGADDDFEFGDDEVESMDDLFSGESDAGNAAGRARKESFTKRARAINEGLLDSMKAYLSQHTAKAPATGSPRARLEALKPFLTAEDYEIVAQFPDQLLTTIFKSMDEAVAAPEVAAPVPAMGGDMGADMDADMGLGSDDFGMDADMEMGGMNMGDDESLDDLGPEHLLQAGGVEDDFAAVPSPLAAVADPDAVVFDKFRESLRKGISPVNAARKIAEQFSIDFADVVAIIKENANHNVPSDKVKVGKPNNRGTVGMTKELPGGKKITRPFASKADAEKHAKDKDLKIEESKKKKKPNPFAKKDDDKKDEKKSDKKDDKKSDKKPNPFAKKVKESSPGKSDARRRAGKPATAGTSSTVMESGLFDETIIGRSDNNGLTYDDPNIKYFEGSDYETLNALAAEATMGVRGWVTFEHEGYKFRAAQARGDYIKVALVSAPKDFELFARRMDRKRRPKRTLEDYQNGSGRMQASSSSAPMTSASSTPAPAASSAPAASKPVAPMSQQQQQKASPSDLAKTKQLADRIAKDVDPETLGDEVAKNIGSVGKGAADVEKYTQYVRDELAARGVVKEAKRKTK